MIDLTDCDREPIHIPSAIQPHGTLLVVEPGSGRVIQTGVGAERLIPLSSPPFGQRLTDVLGVPTGIVGRAAYSRKPVYISSLVPELAGHADIDITAHRADRLILIEIERALAARPSAAHMLGLVRSIAATLQLGQDLLATCRSATRGLRCLTV